MANNITLYKDGEASKTVVQPQRLNPYAPSNTAVLVPIDGPVITQVSNNRDNYGDKNVIRQMEWGAIPESSTDYTHTVVTLKALEGEDCVLDTSGCFGYSTAQDIVVVSVNIDWIAYAGDTNWFTVLIDYTHR